MTVEDRRYRDLIALRDKWRERERKLCQRADQAEAAGNGGYARATAAQAERIAECADELADLLLAGEGRSEQTDDEVVSRSPTDGCASATGSPRENPDTKGSRQ